MKYLSFMSFVFAATVSLQAANQLGSECGLTDAKEDSSWIQIGKGIDLSRADELAIDELPTLVKQQLIIAAKHSVESKAEIHNTLQAVNYLREFSDGQSLYVNNYRVKGRRVTEVLHFPGDNPYGTIFAAGTKHVIAFNGDDTILCK